MNNVLWRVVDFTLHLNSLFLLVAHFDTEDPEVTASQVKCNEVSFLCGGKCQFNSVYFRLIYIASIHNNSYLKVLSACN